MRTLPRQLLGSVLVAAAVLVVCNGLLGRAMRNDVPHRLRRVLVGRAQTRTLAIGNSTMAAGFDPAAFDAVWKEGAPALNAGLGAGGNPQWYVAWRLASDGHQDLRHVIIGVFDLLATGQKFPPWHTWHSNESFAFLADASFAEPYGTANAADRLLYRTFRLVPMFVERGAPWTKVEQVRRSLGSWGMPMDQGSNAFGRINDFTALLARDAEVLGQESMQAVRDGAPLSPPVRDIMVEARRKGVQPVLVMMPLHPARHSIYETKEWRDYLAHVSSLAARHGARVISATQWISDAGMFDDQVHLNAKGAAHFTRRLAQELSAGTSLHQ